jgi:hypothetical protein
MQFAPNSTAGRTPVHFTGGWGGRHLNSPTGGAANGMPLNDATPSAIKPCTSPLSTRTIAGVWEGGGSCESAAVPTPIATASAASEHHSILLPVEAAPALSPRSVRMRHPLLLKPCLYFPKDREITVRACVALPQPA